MKQLFGKVKEKPIKDISTNIQREVIKSHNCFSGQRHMWQSKKSMEASKSNP